MCYSTSAFRAWPRSIPHGCPAKALPASQRQQLALEALWALHQCGGFDDAAALLALEHTNPHVRRWAVRLLGDRKEAPEKLEAALAKLAAGEKDPEVRSQLASSAKRLPGTSALPIVAALWSHDLLSC